MPAKTIRRGLAWVAVVLVVAAGAAIYGKRQVERRLETHLQRLIGPARHYRVALGGVNIPGGSVRTATVAGERVQLPNTPVADRLDARLEDVRFDFQSQDLQSVGHADAVARLLPDDIAAFLNEQSAIRDARVALAPPDGATLTFLPEIGGLSLPPGLKVEATGRFTTDGPRARFDLTRLRAAGFSVRGSAPGVLSRAINPIVDLSGLPVRVSITEIRAEDGALVVRATGDYRAR